jgi:hypothetical protein
LPSACWPWWPGGTAGWFSLDKETRGLLATTPTNRDLLFWTVPSATRPSARWTASRFLAKARPVVRRATHHRTAAGPAAEAGLDVDAFMAAQRSAAWWCCTTASCAWSAMAWALMPPALDQLFGGQVDDIHAGRRGHSRRLIKSMDDKVSDYIPQMKGSAYDDVSIRQLLTMTSGVRWNEDYGDPKSDVARFNNHKPEEGVDALVSYMRQLPRVAPAGTRWHYSTGETNLVGILLNQATRKPLATYLSEKIWVPAGMEYPATWILSKTGQEISGCCIQAARATLRGWGSSS